MIAGPADWLAAVPPAVLIVGGIAGLFVAVLVVIAVADPRTRRQLQFVARQTGMGRWLGLVLLLAGLASFVSVFVLGGTTTGRTDYPLAFAFLVHAAGLFLLGDAAGTLPRYLAVRRAPHTDAAEVDPGGRVAVDGEAVAAAEVLETPFAGERALCYELRVMERRGDSDGAINAEERGIGGNWHLEYADEDGVAFAVDDGTGRVLVDPDGAAFDLAETAEVAVGREDDLPDRVREFVTGRQEVGFGAHDRRYVEAALRSGDPVTVVGPVVDGGGTDAQPAGNGPGTRPVGDGSSTQPVVSAREGDCIVGSDDIDGFQSKLRRRVVTAGGGGAGAAVLGYAAMLVVSGAV